MRERFVYTLCPSVRRPGDCFKPALAKLAHASAQSFTYIIKIRSQSGQIQVGPLLIPHLFSSKHSLQI